MNTLRGFPSPNPAAPRRPLYVQDEDLEPPRERRRIGFFELTAGVLVVGLVVAALAGVTLTARGRPAVEPAPAAPAPAIEPTPATAPEAVVSEPAPAVEASAVPSAPAVAEVPRAVPSAPAVAEVPRAEPSPAPVARTAPARPRVAAPTPAAPAAPSFDDIAARAAALSGEE
jgi:outer membrane biosynthesis protein TonB